RASPKTSLRSSTIFTWKARRIHRRASTNRASLFSGCVSRSAASMHSLARASYSSPEDIFPRPLTQRTKSESQDAHKGILFQPRPRIAVPCGQNYGRLSERKVNRHRRKLPEKGTVFPVAG